MNDQDVKDQVIAAIRQAMSQWIGAEVPPDLDFMRAQMSKVLSTLKPEPWLLDIIDRSMQMTFGVGSAREMEQKLKALQDSQIDHLWERFGDGIPLLKFEWSLRHDLITAWEVAEEESKPGEGTNATINMSPKQPLKYIKLELDLGGKDDDGDVPDTPASG
jgi:hypothetical protein